MTVTKSPRSLYSANDATTSEPELATPAAGSVRPNTPVATLLSAPQPATESPQAATPPPVSSEQISKELRQGEADFIAVTMAATREARFDSSLFTGRGRAPTPGPAEASMPPGADTPQEHQSPQAVTEYIEEEDARSSRSMNRARDFLPGGSRSRSRRTGVVRAI